jgi:hypothetical protein
MMLEILVNGIAIAAALLAGMVFSTWMHYRKLETAHDTGASVWIGDRFAYVVPAKDYHHLRVCEHRCKIRDEQSSIIHTAEIA